MDLPRNTGLVPATFWQRVGAGLIDFVLMALVVFSLGKLCSASKPFAEIFVVPLALFRFAYSFVGHALYGRTVGKYLLKIRVVRFDGTPVTWIEALRRSSVDGVFDVIWLVGLMSALRQLPPEAFAMQGWSALYKLLAPLFPHYLQTALSLSGYWMWSEFITMLMNRDRRALHDFIGATRVIRLQRSGT